MSTESNHAALYLEQSGNTYILHAILTDAVGKQLTLTEDGSLTELQITEDVNQSMATLTSRLVLSSPPTTALSTIIYSDEGQQTFITPLDTAVASPPGEPDIADVYFSPGTAGGCRFVIYTTSNQVTYDGLWTESPANEEIVKFILSDDSGPNLAYFTYDHVPYQDNAAQYVGGKPRKKRKPRQVKLRKK